MKDSQEWMSPILAILSPHISNGVVLTEVLTDIQKYLIFLIDQPSQMSQLGDMKSLENSYMTTPANTPPAGSEKNYDSLPVDFGIRNDGSTWIQIGSPITGPHAAGNVNLPPWALASIKRRCNIPAARTARSEGDKT